MCTVDIHVFRHMHWQHAKLSTKCATGAGCYMHVLHGYKRNMHARTASSVGQKPTQDYTLRVRCYITFRAGSMLSGAIQDLVKLILRHHGYAAIRVGDRSQVSRLAMRD